MNYRYLRSRNFGIPSGLFGLFLIAQLLLFTTGSHKYYQLERTLTQWDGQHYLSIARDGYETHPCEHNPRYMCGNVGWFPFYPLVGKLFSFGILDVNLVLIGLSWLAMWLALLIFFKIVTDIYSEKIAVSSLLALLLFPGAFYFLTAFPYSLYFLLGVVVFRFLEVKNYRWLWVPSAALAVTYPSGLAIGLPILYVLLSNWKSLETIKRRQLATALLAIPSALALYGLYYWIQFDDFFLYQTFQAQDYYSHGISFPIIVIYKSLTTYPLRAPANLALLFVWGSVLLFYSRRLPAHWQLYAVAIFLFTPTFGTTVSYYRHVIVAFPFFVSLGMMAESKRKYLLLLYVLAAILLSALVFLPDYKLGQLM